MIRRIILLVAGIALLGGCSGGSAETEKTTKPPVQKTYTAKQLEDALPGTDDIPGAMKELLSCPGDNKLCSEPQEGRAWTVATQLEPGLSGAAAEGAAHEAWFGDTMSLNVSSHETLAMADKANGKLLALNRKFVGDFEIDPQAGEDGNFTPGERGSGSVVDVTLGNWSGSRVDHRSVGTDLKGNISEERQHSDIVVSQGLVTVSVSVSIAAEGRPADDAAKLARQVVEEYLTRLD